MAKAFGANRLRPPHLRLLPGGMRVPAEKIEIRVRRPNVLPLLQTAGAILIVPLSILSVLAAVAAHGDATGAFPFAAPLLGLCAVMVALGVTLMARVLRQLRHAERLGRMSRKNGPAPAGQPSRQA